MIAIYNSRYTKEEWYELAESLDDAFCANCNRANSSRGCIYCKPKYKRVCNDIIRARNYARRKATVENPVENVEN